MDHRVNLQERIFRLITGFGLLALVLLLICKLFTGASIINLLVLAGCIIYVAVVGAVSVSKKRVNTGATFVAILLLILLPINFFTAGGMSGGASLWFIFFIIYVSLTLYGVRRLVFLALCAITAVLCYYMEFHYSYLVTHHTLRISHIDAASSIIIVGGLTSVMILFQNRSLIQI